MFGISLLFFLLPFLVLDRRRPPSTVTDVNVYELNLMALIVAGCLLVLIALGLGEGVTDRSFLRKDATNFNFSFFSTLSTNFVFLQISITAALLAWARRNRSRVTLVLALGLASLILATSGTRYFFLLAISPLIYGVILRSKIIVKAYAAIMLIGFSVYIALRRSVTDLGSDALLFYDLPSSASYILVNSHQPQLSDIWYFFVGNVLVLIPRSIFSDKPIDEATINFVIATLGDSAFESGSTYLPGFLGSAWLYGGIFGVVIFSLILGHLFVLALTYNVKSWQSEAIASLMLVGTLLQFRNISIFYFLPLLYLSVLLKIWSILIRSLRTK
jgi:hypothetical protein